MNYLPLRLNLESIMLINIYMKFLLLLIVTQYKYLKGDVCGWILQKFIQQLQKEESHHIVVLSNLLSFAS